MFGKRCSLCGGKLRNHICTECGLDNRKNDADHSRYGANKSNCDDEPLTHVHMEELDSDERYRVPSPRASEQKAQNARDVIQKNIEQRKVQEEAKRAYGQQQANRSSEYGQSSYGSTESYGDQGSHTQQSSETIKKGLWTGDGPSKNKDTIWKSKSRNGKQKSALSRIISILVILGVLGGIVSEVSQFVKDQVGGSKEEVYSEDVSEYGAPDYSRVTRELNAAGANYDENFTSGYYMVGVHIPEGTYTVSIADGEGWISILDRENSISFYESFYDKGVGSSIEDIRLYQGACVQVGDHISLEFSSNNAQTDTLGGIANPNTEVVTLTENGVAGTDFPAGIYDISLGENSHGIIEVFVPGYFDDDTEDAYPTCTQYLQNTSWQEKPAELTNTCKYLVLPEGTRIELGEEEIGTITLTPSATIKDTNYIQFYEEGLYQLPERIDYGK